MRLDHPKNARRFAAPAIFFLRWAQAIRIIISGPSKSMTDYPPTRTSRFTGETRRFSKKLYAWKKRATALALSRHSTRSSRTKRAQIGGANSSGTTKPDLTRRNYWRTIQNGNLQLLFTKNWPGLGAAGAMKQRCGSTACDWNIFFGRIDPRPPVVFVAESVVFLSE